MQTEGEWAAARPTIPSLSGAPVTDTQPVKPQQVGVELCPITAAKGCYFNWYLGYWGWHSPMGAYISLSLSLSLFHIPFFSYLPQLFMVTFIPKPSSFPSSSTRSPVSFILHPFPLHLQLFSSPSSLISPSLIQPAHRPFSSCLHIFI